MKKNWIYIALVIALVIGFFYIVLEKQEPKEPVVDQEQGQADKETPGEPGKDNPEEKPDEENPSQELPKDDEEEDPEEKEGPGKVVNAVPVVGEPLPDFTLKNLEGEDVTLSEIKGKIVLINFWATWCTWCDKEMPDLQRLKEENEDLVVLAVNVEESIEKAQKYVRDGGYDFEVVLDEKGEVSAQYLVTGLPGSYFVDEKGIFIGRVQGMRTYEQFNTILNDIRDL
nr:redoxin domain-containing protein [Tissierella sp.]